MAAKACDASRKCPTVNEMMRFLREGSILLPSELAKKWPEVPQIPKLEKGSLAFLVEFVVAHCEAEPSTTTFDMAADDGVLGAARPVDAAEQDGESTSSCKSGSKTTLKRPRADSVVNTADHVVAGAPARPGALEGATQLERAPEAAGIAGADAPRAARPQHQKKSVVSVQDAKVLLSLADASSSLKAYRLLWELAQHDLHREFAERVEFFANKAFLSDNALDWAHFLQDILDKYDSPAPVEVSAQVGPPARAAVEPELQLFGTDQLEAAQELAAKRKTLLAELYGRYYGRDELLKTPSGLSATTSRAAAAPAPSSDDFLGDTVLLLLAVLVVPVSGSQATVTERDTVPTGQKILDKLAASSLDSTRKLEAATVLVRKLGRDTVLQALSKKMIDPIPASSTSSGAAGSTRTTKSVIPDDKLAIGPAGSFRDAFAFGAVRFLAVCGDVERVLEISQRDHWRDRDDAVCVVALALVLDAGLDISTILSHMGEGEAGDNILPKGQQEPPPHQQSGTTAADSTTSTAPTTTSGTNDKITTSDIHQKGVSVVPLRHGVVWLLCRLKHEQEKLHGSFFSTSASRQTSASTPDPGLLNEATVELLARIFVRGLHLPVANLFVADAAAKGLVRLFALTFKNDTTNQARPGRRAAAASSTTCLTKTSASPPVEPGGELEGDAGTGPAAPAGSTSLVVKTIFASVQQRTHNESALVAKEEDSVLAKSKDSAVLAARERQNELKEMLFLCRQLGNLNFIIACLDQPTGSSVALASMAAMHEDAASSRLAEVAKKLMNPNSTSAMSNGSSSTGPQLAGVLTTLNALMSMSEKDQQRLADLMDPQKRKEAEEKQEAEKRARVAQEASVSQLKKQQQTASVAGSGFFDALTIQAADVRSLALPAHLRAAVAEKRLVLHQFPPYFFHSNGKLREVIVSISLNYFGIERVQDIGPWPKVYRNLVRIGLSPSVSRVSLREASCRCLTQLLRSGRRWRELEPEWQALWEAVIQVTDDLEPKIEAVAGPLSRTLRSLTIRLCNSSGQLASQRFDAPPGTRNQLFSQGAANATSSTGVAASGSSSGAPAAHHQRQQYIGSAEVQAALSKTLPMLLQFLHLYPHARSLCFDVIHEVAQLTANASLLKPFLLELVPLLLESLNALEHRKVAEYQWDFNRAGAGEKYEQARIAASKDSPSFRLLRRLVPSFDRPALLELSGTLRKLMRQGVGSNTRCGVCDFYSMLAAEMPHVFSQPIALQTLRAIASSLVDESIAVKSAAASAFASIAKRVDDKTSLAEIIEKKLLPGAADFNDDVEDVNVDDAARGVGLPTPKKGQAEPAVEVEPGTKQVSTVLRLDEGGRAGENPKEVRGEVEVDVAMSLDQRGPGSEHRSLLKTSASDLGFLTTSAKALSEIHRRGCDLRSLQLRDRLCSQCFFHQFHAVDRVKQEWTALWLELGFSVRQALTLEPVVTVLARALQSQDRATRMQACRAAVQLSQDLLAGRTTTGSGDEDANKDLQRLAAALAKSVETYKLAYVGASVVLRALVTLLMHLNVGTNMTFTGARSADEAAGDKDHEVGGEDSTFLAKTASSPGALGTRQVQACVEMVRSTRVEDTDRAEALCILTDMVAKLGRGIAREIPVADLYRWIETKLDQKEVELRQEAEKDFAFVAKVRGRGPAEKLLSPVFDLWAAVLDGQDGGGDDSYTVARPPGVAFPAPRPAGGTTGPPAARTTQQLLGRYLQAWLREYAHATGTLRVAMLRALRRILLKHFSTVRVGGGVDVHTTGANVDHNAAAATARFFESDFYGEMVPSSGAGQGIMTTPSSGTRTTGRDLLLQVAKIALNTVNEDWSRIRRAGLILLAAFVRVDVDQLLRTCVQLEELEAFLLTLEHAETNNLDEALHEDLEERQALQTLNAFRNMHCKYRSGSGTKSAGLIWHACLT
ncbi:unnamed protein product [Amoebophrya sp. A120]|nr:unnamed protein product [Amoebophrya sp. A120]|eukprot:GSA120T00005976001.1